MEHTYLNDEEWLLHPDHQSGMPAIYECTLCGKPFRWFRCDGETGPFCSECENKIHKPRHPAELAHSDRFGTSMSPKFKGIKKIQTPKGIRADDV